MTREELLKSQEYWTTLIQNELYRQISSYAREHNLSKAELAEHLDCSEEYVTQILDGDCDIKVSELVKFTLAIGKTPFVRFE